MLVGMRNIWIFTFLLTLISGSLYVWLWNIHLNIPKSSIVPIQDYMFSDNMTLLERVKFITPSYQKKHSEDYYTLINISDFNFTIMNEPCKNISNLLLLVLIHSAPLNLEKRELIRSTWGQRVPDMKLLFVLAAVASDELQEVINEENQEYNDIIQGNFIDAYRNLTYKHVMALKYAIYHCSQAKFVMKMDDDIFVNMPKVIEFLQLALIHTKTENSLLCPMIHTHQKILRAGGKFGQKWAVTIEEYPGIIYPKFCGGLVIIYSPEALFTLYKKTQKEPYFWIDDVHVTGTMALGTNISHVSLEQLVISKDRINQIINMTDAEKPTEYFLFGPTKVPLTIRKTLWEILYAT